MNKFIKTALVAATIMSAASPTLAAGNDGFAIVGGPGTMKCKDALKEIHHSELSLRFFMIWIGGMATGVNFATPGLRDMNPETNNEGLFKLVVKQCTAEPNLLVATAAAKIFVRVSEHEGSWAKPKNAADNPLAERVD